MPVRSHVVISGTGRTGTSFIVEVLTRLELDTGFTLEDVAAVPETESRGGLERNINRPDCPFIVKTPFFCEQAEQVLERPDIRVEHVFIPIRELYAAAESRRRVSRKHLARMPLRERVVRLMMNSGIPGGRLLERFSSQPLGGKALLRNRFAGGLWGTESLRAGDQEAELLMETYKLMLAMADASTPVTLLRYPRLARDCPYLFDKLRPVLGGISYESFAAAFQQAARPEFAHQLSGPAGA